MSTTPVVKIHRSPNGAVLGAALWVPGHIIERCILQGQEEIGVTFEGNRIIIGKEESQPDQGWQRTPKRGISCRRIS